MPTESGYAQVAMGTRFAAGWQIFVAVWRQCWQTSVCRFTSLCRQEVTHFVTSSRCVAVERFEEPAVRYGCA